MNPNNLLGRLTPPPPNFNDDFFNFQRHGLSGATKPRCQQHWKWGGWETPGQVSFIRTALSWALRHQDATLECSKRAWIGETLVEPLSGGQYGKGGLELGFNPNPNYGGWRGAGTATHQQLSDWLQLIAQTLDPDVTTAVELWAKTISLFNEDDNWLQMDITRKPLAQIHTSGEQCSLTERVKIKLFGTNTKTPWASEKNKLYWWKGLLSLPQQYFWALISTTSFAKMLGCKDACVWTNTALLTEEIEKIFFFSMCQGL